MPQSPEQFFAKKNPKKQTESFPKTKEEKALELIREIKGLMNKTERTPEDYQRIIKLCKEIESLFYEFTEAKEMLQRLKETALYDEEKKQWNDVMDEEGKLINSKRYSEYQLLGILVEAIVGSRDEAKEMLRRLKETALYDEEKKQWNVSIDEEGELISSNRYSYRQLLGILVEAIVGSRDEAKEMLQRLKETALYDEEKKQWNEWMNKERKLISSYRYSENQLLGILVEAIVGSRDEAKEMLQRLKETALYDEEKKQWNESMDEEGKLINSNRYSYRQLLGILVEAIVGSRDEAKEMLQRLKETALYDEEKKQWNVGVDKEGKLISSTRYSKDQLLGVLVEAIVGSRDEAKEMLQRLKETALYDEEKKQWNESMDEEGKLISSYRSSEVQLLGVLVEAIVENLEEFLKRIKVS